MPILLAPRWLAVHAAALLAVVLFVLLARWQWDSFQSSERLREAPGTAAAVPLSSLVSAGRALPASAVGRSVTVTGRYDTAHELTVPDRERQDRSGLVVVTPLVTRDGSVVLVARGWRGPGTPAPNPPAAVTVQGVVAAPESPADSGASGGAVLPPRTIAYIGAAEVLPALPYPPDRIVDGYVVLTRQVPEGGAAGLERLEVPAPGRLPGLSPWRYATYAVQWLIFAGAAGFFWVVVIRGALGDIRRARAAAREGAPPPGSRSPSLGNDEPQRRAGSVADGR